MIVLVGIAAFFGGMQYQKSQMSTSLPTFGDRPGGGPAGNTRFGGARGSQAVIGEIISIDDKSVTVKLQDGNSKIVILSTSTSVNKQATGSVVDLKEGERVAVFGTSNSDGSVTAQSIQLNPTSGGRFGITPTPTQ